MKNHPQSTGTSPAASTTGNPTWTCPCGATFAVPPALTGKKVRCPRCGHVETLPEASTAKAATPEASPPPDQAVAEIAIALAPEWSAGPDPSDPSGIQVAKRPGDLDVIIEESEPPPDKPLTERTFTQDLLSSFAFFIEPANAGALFVCALINATALLLMIAACRPSFSYVDALVAIACFAAAVFACGWLFAYYMAIIGAVAAHDDDLPNTSLSDTNDSALSGLVRFFATWLCLLTPAVVLSIVRAYWSVNIPTLWIKSLVIMAIVMWPMAVLCVSIGGLSVFVRFDLMLYSVVASIGAYTVVWIILAAAIFAGKLLVDTIATPTAGAGAPPLSRHPLAAGAFISVLVAYISVVAMRAIGLYYRHFKHRFVWSWE